MSIVLLFVIASQQTEAASNPGADTGSAPGSQTQAVSKSMTATTNFPFAISQDSPWSTSDTEFFYCFADIDCISNVFGNPWKLSKGIPFSAQVPFTGLLWDLNT